MPDSVKITLAQVNPTVGAIDDNVALIRATFERAAKSGTDLVVFPELVVTGYPPEDLVQRQAFLDHAEASVKALAKLTASDGPALLIGAPWVEKDEADLAEVRNAALLLEDGRIAAVRYKHHLPNYGVFDEARVFKPGPKPEPVVFKGLSLGIMVCEDMWFPDVAQHLADKGAELLVVLNGSPFEADKHEKRVEHARGRVLETNRPLVYVNQVGGQDELVFDGGSFIMDAEGKAAARLKFWEPDRLTTTWVFDVDGWASEPGPIAAPPGYKEGIYHALVLGLRDYVEKNGFPGVVIGLSGGIDSALSAAVACDALGPDRIWLVMMDSPYTSQESWDDAQGVCDCLGVPLDAISIKPAMEAFKTMLGPVFEGMKPDTTEENIQARARGLTLMSLSNKFGYMVLSTGNKSEMSVGYATLYGDMCGGFSVLKDVFKTTVFELSAWRNEHKPDGMLGPDGPVMPKRVITKPPSAELKPDQKDSDSLPPYDVLDDILKSLIEHEKSLGELRDEGHDEAVVQRVWGMINRAEYKRRQAPPGVKISARAFGRDRRYPITDAFKELK